MARACTVCGNPNRPVIDGMIANNIPYLQIAKKFGLNQKTVNTHGKNHVHPFINSVELQARAAVVAAVNSYRDEVYLPLVEKSRAVEHRLWNEFDTATSAADVTAYARELRGERQEQSKLTGAYTEAKANPATLESAVALLLEQYRSAQVPEADIEAAMGEIETQAKLLVSRLG